MAARTLATFVATPPAEHRENIDAGVHNAAFTDKDDVERRQRCRSATSKTKRRTWTRRPFTVTLSE